ncbi:hypothetical protein FPCIR_14097 [Fusarium pseudocircinatum]|uniref:Uncharacterized protein n=1 Tax=Fusarium pseudocircinatum TaxID=56676 RepID=A0A8H5KGY9_9HYPO|nr:hypothetical protein FPCIR_14097 [Fusarium pseudocircinatum]
MPSGFPQTIPVTRSCQRGTGGNLSFGEIATATINGQMFHGPGVAQSDVERPVALQPEGGIQGGKEGAVADQNVTDKGNSTATNNISQGQK